MGNHRREMSLLAAHTIMQQIRFVLEFVDAKTDYALNMTMKNMQKSVREAFNSAVSKAPSIKAFEQALTNKGTTVEEAAKAQPEGAEAHAAMLEMEIAFDVWMLKPDVFDKPWPHRTVEGREPPSEKMFSNILVALELIER